jgi:predicted nucleic acid-binding protein
MKKVCVDTNILVWYVKRTATEGQEENIEKSDFLFQYFEHKKIKVVVPSLVVGELMCNVSDDEKRDQIFDYIQEHFEIVQHDVRSAREFSRLRVSLDRKQAKDFAKQIDVPNCRMLNDHNICAVALSNDCDAIFSHNLKDFDKFNNNEIPIYTLDYVEELKKELEAENLIKKPLKDESQVNLWDFADNDDEDDENPPF